MRFNLVLECDAPTQSIYNLESLIEIPSSTSIQLQQRLDEVLKDFIPGTVLKIRTESIK